MRGNLFPIKGFPKPVGIQAQPLPKEPLDKFAQILLRLLPKRLISLDGHYDALDYFVVDEFFYEEE